MTQQVDVPLSPLNSPFESGLRALVLLSEAYPQHLDLQRLLLLDYLAVNSADLDESQPSLHPATPHRSGEVLVRRELVTRGLRLFISRGLIKPHYDDSGISYSATDLSPTFLGCLRAAYTCAIIERSRWVTTMFSDVPDEELRRLFDTNIGRWGSELDLESALYEDLE